MQDDFGYQINMNLYELEQYEVTNFYNCWIGEQGKKVSEKYIGRDDFVLIKPKFYTNYSYLTAEGDNKDGSFDIFVDEARLNCETDIYQSPSWHYSYSPQSLVNTKMFNQGQNNNNLKVLLLCDSYSYVMAPFLLSSVQELDTIILRSCDIDLQDRIQSEEYDLVIVAYAEFMIGAHDDETSSNYNMFSFTE